jgi:prefoldin subunit 5
MPTPNPVIKNQIEEAKRQLAELRAEKTRLFPPNPHPFSQPDAYPKNYTPAQIARHNELNAQIESLENRIEELQRRLYSK